MTVYVDNARNKLGRMRMAHMMADDLQELHWAARRIGCKPEWFQEHRFPHYDICLNKRALAIKYGAQQVTTKDLIRIYRRRQEAGPFYVLTPRQAERAAVKSGDHRHGGIVAIVDELPSIKL